MWCLDLRRLWSTRTPPYHYPSLGPIKGSLLSQHIAPWKERIPWCDCFHDTVTGKINIYVNGFNISSIICFSHQIVLDFWHCLYASTCLGNQPFCDTIKGTRIWVSKSLSREFLGLNKATKQSLNIKINPSGCTKHFFTSEWEKYCIFMYKCAMKLTSYTAWIVKEMWWGLDCWRSIQVASQSNQRMSYHWPPHPMTLCGAAGTRHPLQHPISC